MLTILLRQYNDISDPWVYVTCEIFITLTSV